MLGDGEWVHAQAEVQRVNAMPSLLDSAWAWRHLLLLPMQAALWVAAREPRRAGKVAMIDGVVVKAFGVEWQRVAYEVEHRVVALPQAGEAMTPPRDRK